ncbi:MAG: hypothetical protein H6839_06720 [Planctomycetes bacterium]|nr:hypothetical protein [Planctomycetota bacterium]
MSRWIAAVLLLGLALVLSFAQDTPKDPPMRFPFAGSKSQLPFDVVEIDGKKAWRIVGRGNVKIEELIAGYTTATGKRVSFDARAAEYGRASVPYIGPDDAMLIPHAELGDFVSELLEGADLTLVGHSTDKARVVRMDDATGYARVVEPADLANLPDTEWVTLTFVDLQSDARNFRNLFGHFSKSRTYLMSDDNALTATGRVAQLREVEKLLRKLESGNTGSNGMQVRSYELGTAKPADAARTLNELFDEGSSSVQMLADGYTVNTQVKRRINATPVPGTNKLLVRASVADHDLVQSAINAMK